MLPGSVCIKYFLSHPPPSSRITRAPISPQKKYRTAKKISKHQYHSLYLQVKGARYKTKRALMEQIHKLKTDAKREKSVEEQATAAKLKASKKKEKKEKKPSA